MADYWRGGWANQGMLPGTQAAMTAKQAGGSYGPLNALADILGAYWQKKSERDVNKAVDELEANWDTDMAPQAPAMGSLMVAQDGQVPQAPQAPKPLSLNEYATQAKGKRAKLLRELARKHGYGAVQNILPMVDEVINGKILGYANTARDNVYGALQNASMETLPGLLKQVDEYNSVVSPIGGTPIDLKGMLSMLGSKVSNVDTGGQIRQVAAPANGLPYSYKPVYNKETGELAGYVPEYTRPAGVFGKSMTPEGAARVQETNRHNLASEGETQRHNRTNEGISDAAKAQGQLEYWEHKKNNPASGSGGKATVAQKGAVNQLNSKAEEIRSLYASGGDVDTALGEYADLMKAAYENGHFDDEDMEYFNDKLLGLRGEIAKAQGDDDTAAYLWGQVKDWSPYEGVFGKQPYH